MNTGKGPGKEESLLSKARETGRRRTEILKELRRLYVDGIPDEWDWDGMEPRRYLTYSYENTFRSILSQIKVNSFQELVAVRASELGRDLNVLDLFGGAYFLSDLTQVSRLVGVRLDNIDELLTKKYHDLCADEGSQRKDKVLFDEFVNIVNNKKRKILERNVYEKSTLDSLREDSGLGEGEGFDIAVCRPVGPFKDIDREVPDRGVAREEIFIAILNRTLSLLNPDGGMLFTQMPRLKTNKEIFDAFWEKYISEKQEEGYEFIFEKFFLRKKKPSLGDDVFAVRRKYQGVKDLR